MEMRVIPVRHEFLPLFLVKLYIPLAQESGKGLEPAWPW
jgi:hypothetical protein